MPLNTASVVTAITPTVIGSWFSHQLNKKSRRDKPTERMSYDLGLNVVRGFIEYTAKHTVEDLQGFTAQWVPAPHWVKTEAVSIPNDFSKHAARLLQLQLGPKGVAEVGGDTWWQWRKGEQPLKAEWIEMRADYNARMGEKSDRILLYIHGGAYYFGSVDEHRYQVQRHARKLKARAFAPRYRLAPQFPFPCGLHDAITSYLYLLSEHDPKTILIAGDSAGGGMVTSLLVTMRDQGIPLPAGAMLLSPWVDLTHSFPSILGDGELDYIPTSGFIHRPSVAWPPPHIEASIEMLDPSEDPSTLPGAHADGEAYGSSRAAKSQRMSSNVSTRAPTSSARESTLTASTRQSAQTRPREPQATHNARNIASSRPEWIPSHIPAHHVTPKIEVDGAPVYIQEQIQLYAPNHLLVTPLVSPVLSPSLGGLCPLLIQVGGGELLCDEQVYFAHKAANPTAYPPNNEVLDRWDPDRTILNKYPPTNVQVQVWEDMCHVPHTLSWTRPSKHLYRSVAQFGAWALARAQQAPIDIDDNDSLSSDEEEDTKTDGTATDQAGTPLPRSPAVRHFASVPANLNSAARAPTPRKHINHPASDPAAPAAAVLSVPLVGRAGDPLPPFVDYMIRQRIDRNGHVFPLDPPGAFFSLQLIPGDIGVIKEAPVARWRERQIKWDKRFAKKKAAAVVRRAELEKKGLPKGYDGQRPPPTALIRRWLGEVEVRGYRQMIGDEVKRPVSFGLKWWAGLGSKHDEEKMTQSDPPSEETDTDTTTDPIATTTTTTTTRRPSSLPRRTSHPRRPSSARPSTHRSPSVRSPRRASATVTDAGQADAHAIYSGTVSPAPTTSGTPAGRPGSADTAFSGPASGYGFYTAPASAQPRSRAPTLEVPPHGSNSNSNSNSAYATARGSTLTATTAAPTPTARASLQGSALSTDGSAGRAASGTFLSVSAEHSRSSSLSSINEGGGDVGVGEGMLGFDASTPAGEKERRRERGGNMNGNASVNGKAKEKEMNGNGARPGVSKFYSAKEVQ